VLKCSDFVYSDKIEFYLQIKILPIERSVCKPSNGRLNRFQTLFMKKEVRVFQYEILGPF
jgi:hypothetical protein